jgi:CHASE3 domain sensor protein
MPGKSFIQAVQQLLTEVCNAISQLKGFWAFGELWKSF